MANPVPESTTESTTRSNYHIPPMIYGTHSLSVTGMLAGHRADRTLRGCCRNPKKRAALVHQPVFYRDVRERE